MIKALSTLFVMGTALVSAQEVEDGVYVLNDSNFDGFIKSNDYSLVEFYAPWCGHCKKLTPEWSSAAKALASSNSPVKLAKVDATEAKALGERFEIKGFPTIKMFKFGSASDYQGGRTSADIVTYANKASGPAAKTLETEDDLAIFQESNEVFVIGYFSDAQSASAKAFVNAAGADDENAYAISSSDAIKAKLGVSADTVSVFKTGEPRADHSGPFDASLKQWIAANSLPLINEFTPESSKKIFGHSIKKHALFFTTKGADHHESAVSLFRDIAKEHQGSLLVVHVSSSEKKVLEYFGFSESKLPALALADLGNEGMKKFIYSGSFDKAPVSEFVGNFLTGGLKPTLKSEEPHPDDLKDHVKVLKGTSFKSLVLDNDKDVLVEFYAPWCGHCKKLAPTWDELGKTFADVPSVVIAKTDATANEFDVAGMNVKGFPTIYFFKGSDKTNPVKYEEGRELEDFIHYLEENAATKFSLKHGDHTHGEL